MAPVGVTRLSQSRMGIGFADITLTLPGLRAKPSRYPAFTARYCTRRERQARSRKSEGRVRGIPTRLSGVYYRDSFS